MKKTQITLILCLICLGGVFLPPPAILSAPGVNAAANTVSVSGPSPPLVPRTVRVAVYNEPNLTAPTYATNPGLIYNNASELAAMLQSNGISTTLLDVQDISNHQLMTADYDVLALVDNFPRENITTMVEEFWLGGGGLLVLDGAAGFLTYFGILPPEAATTSGSPTYWGYASENITVMTRHPVTKSYSIGDQIQTGGGYLRWNWTELQGSAIAGDLTRLARSDDAPDTANVLAFDPTDRGGKIATFAYDYNWEVLPGIHQMIVDACDWLCPRPKGRILFDLSHQPRLGVDPWDSLTMFPGVYFQMRNLYVNHSYTFDKLYPAATGNNFTDARLNPYDMLIVSAPDYHYIAHDRTAVTNWVSAGGGLLVLGEDPTGAGFLLHDQRINYLLNEFDLRMNTTVGAYTQHTISLMTTHPTTEGCSDLYFDAHGYVNITGSAYAIWNYTSSNIVVAGQSYGSGRVILASDINFPGAIVGTIGDEDNAQYTLNLANWLTACQANVLVYTDDYIASNYYRTPVAQALNDLGVSYALTFTFSYLNLSMNLYQWDLVIIDNVDKFGLNNYFDDIQDYVTAGGRLLFTYFNIDAYSAHPLWSELGFSFSANIIADEPLYIWDAAHDIFNKPNAYGAANFTSALGYTDDGDRLTVSAGATALAGYTTTSSAGEAVIVLRNDGKTLYNAYCMEQFSGDTDDSTYSDALELWENEIYFMLRPLINFTVILPSVIAQGVLLQVQVNVTNTGISDASNGYITLSVPPAMGTLSSAITQNFNVPSATTAIVTWDMPVTGLGSFTLNFSAGYDIRGLSFTTDFAAATTVVPPAGIPLWILLLIVAIIAIIIVVLLICFLRRKKSK